MGMAQGIIWKVIGKLINKGENIDMLLQIAELLIDISPDYPHTRWTVKPFLTRFRGKADLSVSFEGCDSIVQQDGKPLTNGDIRWICNESEDIAFSVYVNREKSDEVLYRLDVNSKWDQACIYFLNRYMDTMHPFKGYLGSVLFRNALLFHYGILIHASAVEYKGRGILFTAPSGTGKSTQARLWKNMKKAKILNDDSPALKIKSGKTFIFGTPWGGKSDIFMNRHAPLSAIFILEQASENSLRRIDGSEAVVMLMPRFFLPYFSENLMQLAVGIIDEIIKSTPVYHFRCRPDREAVEMVNQCIR